MDSKLEQDERYAGAQMIGQVPTRLLPRKAAQLGAGGLGLGCVLGTAAVNRMKYGVLISCLAFAHRLNRLVKVIH
jgi:hypothetical protein